jgi:hypothetical protein
MIFGTRLSDTQRNAIEPWPTRRRSLWLLFGLIVLLFQGPSFVRSLYPPRTITYDFYQEWSSARNLFTGLPIYTDIKVTVPRYLGWRFPEDPWYWTVNAHPPASVLLAIPLAWLDYPDAFLVWSIISLAALAGSLWIVIRQLDIRFSRWSVVPVITLLLLCNPFRQQVVQGQLTLLLLLLVTMTWAAARSGRPWLAGTALGAATAIKIFPGFLFFYYVLRREWKVVMGGLVTLAAITTLSATVLGVDAHRTYVLDVLPTVAQWRTEWVNASLVGFWYKLFDPVTKANAIVPMWRSPALALAGTFVSVGLLIFLLFWAIGQAKSQLERDHAFGLAITTILLISPITWDFNLVLLFVPLSVMWVRLPPYGIVRWSWVVVVVAFFLPPGWVWRVFIPGRWPDRVATASDTLTALSFQCYALLGLFALQIVWEKLLDWRPHPMRWRIGSMVSSSVRAD